MKAWIVRYRVLFLAGGFILGKAPDGFGWRSILSCIICGVICTVGDVLEGRKG